MTAAHRHLLVLRHGQSVWNAEGRWQGQADPPLSGLGEEQAREAAKRLVGIEFSALVSSHLRRARHTAEILAEALGLEVQLEPELREIHVGDWTGLTREEIHAGWPGALADWSEGRSDSTPGGEDRHALAARADRSLRRLAAAAGAGERLLVVTHGALIRHLDRSLGLVPEGVPNLGGRWYQADGNSSVVPGERVSLADPEDTTESPNP